MEQLQNVQLPAFVDNAVDFADEDDLDALFMQLEPIAPPASLVENIMMAVSNLPLALHQALSEC